MLIYYNCVLHSHTTCSAVKATLSLLVYNVQFLSLLIL